MRKTAVWVVDDDREFLAELREALVMSGYDAEAFPDAASARQRLLEAAPDVVLLDLKMEPESGFDFARELARLPGAERMPVIAMTGHFTSREHARLIGECGISLCLVKPLNLADVIDRIALVTGASFRAKKPAGGSPRGAGRHDGDSGKGAGSSR